ncbi:hypothetical protein B9Z55_026794 [Caenorhabditis nigoni]|nr:hypothetical protein B9Z55_026794 [Caenorhabditis nigoni]
MLTYKMGRRRRLYSHKQLILFHDSQSKIFDETHKTDTLKLPSTFFEMKDFEKFLQVAHGVQLILDSYDDSWGVIMIAHRYGTKNVLTYCERQLIMDYEEFREFCDSCLVIRIIKRAIKFNLYRLLAFSLEFLFKNYERDTYDLFNSLNWGEMTNESMKIVMANVLYGEH